MKISYGFGFLKSLMIYFVACEKNEIWENNKMSICWLRNVSLVRTMNRFKCARKNSKDSTFSDQMSSLVCYHPVIYSDQTWLETLDLQTVVHLWHGSPKTFVFCTYIAWQLPAWFQSIVYVLTEEFISFFVIVLLLYLY